MRCDDVVGLETEANHQSLSPSPGLHIGQPCAGLRLKNRRKYAGFAAVKAHYDPAQSHHAWGVAVFGHFAIPCLSLMRLRE
jgi:hypothetical protein